MKVTFTYLYWQFLWEVLQFKKIHNDVKLDILDTLQFLIVFLACLTWENSTQNISQVLQINLVWRRNWYKNLSCSSVCLKHNNTLGFFEEQRNKIFKITPKVFSIPTCKNLSSKVASQGDAVVVVTAAAEMSCFPSYYSRQRKSSFAAGRIKCGRKNGLYWKIRGMEMRNKAKGPSPAGENSLAPPEWIYWAKRGVKTTFPSDSCCSRGVAFALVAAGSTRARDLVPKAAIAWFAASEAHSCPRAAHRRGKPRELLLPKPFTLLFKIISSRAQCSWGAFWLWVVGKGAAPENLWLLQPWFSIKNLKDCLQLPYKKKCNGWSKR